MTQTIMLDPAIGAETPAIEPQSTSTSSESLEIIEMGTAESFSELRNNSAFDFWRSTAEDIY